MFLLLSLTLINWIHIKRIVLFIDDLILLFDIFFLIQ